MQPNTGLENKRIAVYGRFSSDKQNPGSAEDQVARCIKFVEARGGVVDPRMCFKDEGISGASLLRPEFERMMSLVRARTVDVIVVEDTDRLSRDMADSAYLFKELRYYDVEMLSAADGMSSFAPTAKTHLLLKSFVSESYLDNLRDKTLRGQTARFNNGFATGGVAYGFRTTEKKDQFGKVTAHEIHIDDEQAKIVRRIYDEYDRGCSLAAIAAGLNRDGVEPPRSRKRTGTVAWSDSTIRAMLHNKVYAGTWEFARRRWTKVPGTNLRRPKPRSPSDMPMAQERPHLRIVSEKIWAEVQARLAAVHRHYTRGNTGKESIHGKQTQFPFSGIVVCDHCGSLMFIYGRGDKRRYRCTGNAKRGVCSNTLTVLETVTRTKLLEAVSKTLSNDFGLAYARKVAAQQKGARAREVAKEMVAKKAELAKTENRIRVLIEQFADSGGAEYLRKAVDEFSAKARILKSEITTLENTVTEPIELPSPEVIKGYVKNLQAFIDRDPAGGREYLRKLLKGRQVRLQAQPDGIYIARTELLPMVLLTTTPPPGLPEEASFSSACCGGRI